MITARINTNRTRIQTNKIVTVIVLFISICVSLIGCGYNYNDIYVMKVLDGDTIKLINGQKVRLVGIDSPELYVSNKLYRDARRTGRDIAAIQSDGREAYGFTKNLVERQRVRLEFDTEEKDRYGRLLAYVYLRDGTFVNAKIIERGYANLNNKLPNTKYAGLFRELYLQAQEDKRGLWR